MIARWRCQSTDLEAEARGSEHHAILAVAGIGTDMVMEVDGRIVHDGLVPAGAFQLLMPGHHVRAVFRSPADFLRLHIPPEAFLSSILDAGLLDLDAELGARPCHDDLIRQLSTSAFSALRDQTADRRFLECVSTAMIVRAMSVLRTRKEGPEIQGLVTWRLKRVLAFVDRHLESPLSLADLASAAGLSRMHFAAQFRLAMACSPHAYLTRRRIERAQWMLAHTTTPLVEIALSVGFQSQAHFTTVFKKQVGETPGRWRHLELADEDGTIFAAA